jgi:hypothetical protein
MAPINLPLTLRHLSSHGFNYTLRALQASNDSLDSQLSPIGEKIAFTTRVWFGSHRQEMELLVDTGSSVSSIPSFYVCLVDLGRPHRLHRADHHVA